MILNNYQHIIWDWNGTLLDDAWLCVESVNVALAKRGLDQLTTERYLKTFDFPVIDFYRHLGFDLEKESFSDLAVEYHSLYGNRWSECELQSGALSLLQHIADSVASQSMLSAAPQFLLDEGMRHYELQSFFTRTIGSQDNHAHGKIDEGKNLIEKLNIPHHQVLLIGDTTHDYHVANAIGADCILVLGGHHHQEKLKTCPAPIYESLEELIEQ